MKAKSVPEVDCSHCGRPAVLVTGEDVYPHRPDLADKPIWRCLPCNAWVGCHKGTLIPMGTIANAELREARRAAHFQFDQLWKSGAMSRGSAYRRLAEKFGLKVIHIGESDVETCRKIVEVSQCLMSYKDRPL